MAAVTRQVEAFNDDSSTLSYTYDDVSLLIQSVTLVNNGPSGTATAVARDLNTQATIFGPISRPFGTGSFTEDVSALGLHMVMVAGRGGSAAQLPFSLEFGWSSA